ncbi:xylulokinase [Candidatus Solirubrobacter pratensis]|uniref:xylulokinase n=1 Tax=Candidatus Solirubrobacter pratensis TaxID=1298857 RepID=UPI000422B3C3|nr:FGGY family carbohydrate kinase [Candidatus Solirubrobacter pratensis]
MDPDGAVFVAIDAGTTGARACAVSLDGRLVHEVRRPYPLAAPRPGWAEQNPVDWRERALESLAELARALGPGVRIEAIGLTGQCPTVAPMNGRGEPVGPGMLYRDNRATAEAAEMRTRIGEAEMHARTGHVAEAFHVGPKVLWLRAHEPAVFAATERFMQPRDIVLHALTGTIATDETHANATVFFDLRARDWAGALLDACSLEASVFPGVLAPWAQPGEVTPAVARRTGVPAGCPVVIGAADSQCAAFGSGVTAPGPVSEMAGSSSCLNSVVAAPLADRRVTHYSHVIPDVFSTELGLNTTGRAVQWALGRFGFDDYAALERAARSVHDRLRDGSAGDPLDAAPVFLPYLGDGERDDVRLRAAVVGLSDRHGREELAYAVLEGVAFGVAETIAILVAAGSPCEELRVAGGGARLPSLGAIKADALGVPVAHLDDDTSPIGVALLAASTAGWRREAETAIAAGLARAARFEPAPRGREALLARFAWWSEVRGSDTVRTPIRADAR